MKTIAAAVLVATCLAWLAFSSGTQSSSETVKSYARGDLNCDYRVSADDALLLLSVRAGVDVQMPLDCPAAGSPATPACVVATSGPSDSMAAPSELHTERGGLLAYALEWADNSSNESCFVVERAVTGIFEVVSLVPADTEDCTDWSLMPPPGGSGYVSYRLYAANQTERSEYSEIASSIFDYHPTPSPTPGLTPFPTPTPDPTGFTCGGVAQPPQRADFECNGDTAAADAVVLLAWMADVGIIVPAGCPKPDSPIAAS
jgi:hypothetical protein